MTYWSASKLHSQESPYPLPFPTEQEAVDHVVEFLTPYCVGIWREPVLRGSTLRPDIGFKLHHLPDVRLVVEVKKFTAPVDGRMRNASVLIDAIRQAHSYTEVTGQIAVVGPIRARNPSDFLWTRSPMGMAALLASEFSVGMLYLDGDGNGGIYIGDQAPVRFYGGTSELHPRAQTLLARKHFRGSKTWRQVA